MNPAQGFLLTVPCVALLYVLSLIEHLKTALTKIFCQQ